MFFVCWAVMRFSSLGLFPCSQRDTSAPFHGHRACDLEPCGALGQHALGSSGAAVARGIHSRCGKRRGGIDLLAIQGVLIRIVAPFAHLDGVALKQGFINIDPPSLAEHVKIPKDVIP